jgi:hypothetical protein
MCFLFVLAFIVGCLLGYQENIQIRAGVKSGTKPSKDPDYFYMDM